MKKTISIFTVIIIICTFTNSSSQTYDGAFYEMFFGPSPSARAEAMGRSIASIPGDPNSYFFNPAALAALNGMNVNGGGTSTGQYDLYSSASLGYGSASWKFGKLGTLGLSVETFNSGEFNLTYTNENSDTISGKFSNHINNFRLTICSEVTKDFYAGGNLNFFAPDENFGYLPAVNGNQSGPYLYMDIGVLKSFSLNSSKLKQELNIGASIINLNSAGYKYSDGQDKGKLPVILRIGSSYSMQVYPAFNFYFNVEYEDILNSKYYGGLHTGFEFSLVPVLYLRTGYYTQDIPNKDIHGQFTFGIGVDVLLLGYFTGMEAGEMPGFNIIFDYSHLSLPSFTTERTENNKSNLYSLTFTTWF